MNKLAVFVEGYTEVLYAEKLITEIAGAHSVRFELRRILGGTMCRRTMRLLRTTTPEAGQQYYVRWTPLDHLHDKGRQSCDSCIPTFWPLPLRSL